MIALIALGCTGGILSDIQNEAVDSDVLDTGDPVGPEAPWYTAEDVPAGLDGNTGLELGDVAADFELTDQFGEAVSLHQFYGTVVLLDLFAPWSSPCQQVAADNQLFWEEMSGRPFTHLGLMEEGMNGPANAGDARDWVAAHGITHPVLVDPEQTQMGYVSAGFPTYVVLDETLRIVETDLYPMNAGARQRIRVLVEGAEE